MPTHPNRSKKARPRKANPTPAEIRRAREAAELTQSAAADVVYATKNGWAQWEAGTRKMHPASFELFLLKTEQIELEDVIEQAEIRTVLSE